MNNDELRIIKNQDFFLNEISRGICQVVQFYDDNAIVQTVDSLILLINDFQTSPQLLDKSLPSFVQKLSEKYTQLLKEGNDDGTLRKVIALIMYNFCKIRGLELVSNLLSTDINLFNIIFDQLRHIVSNFNDKDHWHELSFLLLWLSVLILSPFALQSLSNVELIHEICFEKLLMKNNSNSYLNDVDVLLYSKFLSRVDSIEYLRDYYHKYLEENFRDFSTNQTLTNLKILLNLLKLVDYKPHRDLLNVHYNLISQKFHQIESSASYSSLILQQVIKNYGHLSTAFLKIINSSLDDVDEDLYLQRIEDTISSLMSIISNKDTIIRYSNAKNIAKIAVLLPQEFQLDILSNVIAQLEIDQATQLIEKIEEKDLKVDIAQNIHINFDLVSINKVHGTFLVVAELLKKGLISIENEEYINLIYVLIKPFFYFKRFQINSALIGANIRDAVLYIVWNLLKYNSGLLKRNKSVLVLLFQHLVFISCFDTDLIIRRSASAVIQEMLGRFGTDIWLALSIDQETANKFSVSLVELLEFNKLNDLDVTYFENSVAVFTMLPGFQSDFFKLLLCTETDVLHAYDKLIKNANLSLGIFSIDHDSQKKSSILVASLFELKIEQCSSNEKKIDWVKKLISSLEYVLLQFGNTKIKPGLFFTASELLKTVRKSSKDGALLDVSSKHRLDSHIGKLKDSISAFTFDYHKDLVHVGEEIMKILVELLFYYDKPNYYSGGPTNHSNSLPEHIIENLVFNIIRQNSEAISLLFKHFIVELSKYEFLEKNAEKQSFVFLFTNKLMYYIKNGNLISSKNVGYLKPKYLVDQGFLTYFANLITDKKISYEIRENLIFSIGNLIYNVSRADADESIFDAKFLRALVDQLNDYTLTEQGDVGSKIRLAAINTIEKNLEFFINMENEGLSLLIESRLLRISSEVIDKVKYKALVVLIKFKFANKENIKNYFISIADAIIYRNDYFRYYMFLFHFYYTNYALNSLVREKFSVTQQPNQEFWKGICLTGGSIHGSDLSVLQSTDALIEIFDNWLTVDLDQWENFKKSGKGYPYKFEFLYEGFDKNLSESDQLTQNQGLKRLTINYVLYLLREPTDNEKMLNYNSQKDTFYDQEEKVRTSCLNLLVKLINSKVELVQDKQNDEDKLIIKKLFVRTYNMEIKNKSPSTLLKIIDIHEYLIMHDYAKRESMKRLDTMLKKFIRKKPIATKIIESLYAIYTSEMENSLANYDELKLLTLYLKESEYQKIVFDVTSKKLMLPVP